MLARAASRWAATLAQLAGDGDQPVELGVDRRGVGLVIDRVQQGLDPGPGRFRRRGHQIRGVVSAAALPGRAGRGGRRWPRSGHGARRGSAPPRPGRGRSGPGATGVSPRCFGAVTCRPRISRCPSRFTPAASSAWTLTTRPPSRTFSTSASAATERYTGRVPSGRVRKSSTTASRSAAMTLTCDLLSRVMPRDSTSFSIRRVPTPSRRPATTGQAASACCWCSQQPVREIGPGPEPGNGDVQGADPGVEVPVPVTITDVDPARAGNPDKGHRRSCRPPPTSQGSESTN